MSNAVRVLYSFPLRLGADRICYTAWEQVRGLHAAGARVTVMSASVERALPTDVSARPTLARGRWKVPIGPVGVRRASAVHDAVVAHRLRAWASDVDVVHAWPLGAERTLLVAHELGIPTFLERPNAHTRVAYDAVEREASRIGVSLPPGGEHVRDRRVLRREEREYELASRILCPSQFVLDTFLSQGFSADALARHTYGYDESRFWPGPARAAGRPLTVLFAGFSAVRKGLHIALAAWLQSRASENGSFLVAGTMLPAYRDHLAPQLAHPSVKVLGQRDDLPVLMRQCDALVLPSFEEGFGLVCLEAMASGCVPLVSTTCTDLCRHDVNALVHDVGDAGALSTHFTRLATDPHLLSRLREAGVRSAPRSTWKAAGQRLLEVYQDVLAVR